jgi:hypothetical protein
MALGQPAAAQFTTIFRTDYDLLQAAVQLLLVGTQTTPGVLDRGKGYGQTLASLESKQFPFDHTITSITNSNPAVVNTATDHNYRVGDIILINPLNTGNPVWDTQTTTGTSISNRYFKVAASPVPGARSFGIQQVAGGNVDTRGISGFPTWPSGKTGTVSQPVVSATQFINLREDLRKVYTHQEGIAPSQSVLPTPVRGSIINHSVYLPYYSVTDSTDNTPFKMQESTIYTHGTVPVRTSSWTTSIELTFDITWRSATEMNTYFNTGSLMRWDLDVTDLGTGQQGQKNTAWKNIVDSVFPLYYGAVNKAQMGYTDATKWASSGAYNAVGTEDRIAFGSGVGVYNMNTCQVWHRTVSPTDRSLRFRIRLTDDHSNVFVQNVTARFEFRLNLIYTVGSIVLPFDATNNTQLNFSVVSNWV